MRKLLSQPAIIHPDPIFVQGVFSQSASGRRPGFIPGILHAGLKKILFPIGKTAALWYDK